MDFNYWILNRISRRRSQAQLEAVRGGRGVKAAALALVLLGALAGCGWPDRAAAALLALLLVRCHLSVSEVGCWRPQYRVVTGEHET